MSINAKRSVFSVDIKLEMDRCDLSADKGVARLVARLASQVRTKQTLSIPVDLLLVTRTQVPTYLLERQVVEMQLFFNC